MEENAGNLSYCNADVSRSRNGCRVIVRSNWLRLSGSL